MKTYFKSGNYEVVDCERIDFARYQVTGTIRAFDNLEEAVLYCIGVAKGKSNDSELMVYVETFMTMINK